MKISYNTLNKFFDGKLPSPEIVANELTFHSWEIEEIIPMEGDIMIDVKVLPDKSAWGLSHRGVAKDLSVILNMPLAFDPLKEPAELSPKDEGITVSIETDTCTRYTAALIRGVNVGPSPEWLVKALKTLGQRSINNIVDITNYVMFGVGQPLHAFDAGKLEDINIRVRNAKAGEKITTLTGEIYELTEADALIVDGTSDAPVGIAGIKGGAAAEVTNDTVDILLESANFRAVPVRKTSQRLRLRTDASTRYENGIVPELAAYGLRDAVKFILEVAGGELVGYADTGVPPREILPVRVSIEKINSVLGLVLETSETEDILKRFGYTYTLENGHLTVTPPFERTDLRIPEDLIEEIGRMHGYADVPSITPDPLPATEINKRFYYSEIVRDTLTGLGFSEVYTSSFRNNDTVRIKNALATDKEYLRSSLHENLKEALLKNIAHQDLLGIPFVGIFEIGTVFDEKGERFTVAFGVRHSAEYKEKKDGPILEGAKEALVAVLGTFETLEKEGIIEFDLGALLLALPEPTSYGAFSKGDDAVYVPFSLYPSMSRDVAFWVPDGSAKEDIEKLLKDEAGDLCARISLFDEFSKDGRTSYAFRLVFQSYEKTLTDNEINAVMDRVYRKIADRGFETR